MTPIILGATGVAFLTTLFAKPTGFKIIKSKKKR